MFARVRRVSSAFSAPEPVPRLPGAHGAMVLQTIYVKMADGKTVEDAKAALEAAYEGERFVTVLPGSAVPHTRHVRGRWEGVCSSGWAVCPARPSPRAC